MPCAGRPGFAVIIGLFTVILFGALATAMVFAANAEARASATLLGASRSLSAAEAAAWNAIAAYDWTPALSSIPGQATQIASGVFLVRLDSTCFFVQASAVGAPNTGGNARFVRRVGVTIEVTRDSTGVVRALRVPNRAWTELF